jgi:hypothetical protein
VGVDECCVALREQLHACRGRVRHELTQDGGPVGVSVSGTNQEVPDEMPELEVEEGRMSYACC